MFLYLGALFPFMLLFSIYRENNKITISPPYLVLFRQTWLIFELFFILYIGKKEHLYISPPYLSLFQQSWLIFIDIVIFSLGQKTIILFFYRAKDNINSYLRIIRQTWIHYSFFYIGKSTLFILISAKYGKLGRAAALFSLFYTIFELIILLFYIGKKTINVLLFFSL